MNAGRARLDDALALSRHAADLAARALDLARPDHDDTDLDAAGAVTRTAVTRTAVAVRAVATTVVDRHLAGRHADRPGDTR